MSKVAKLKGLALGLGAGTAGAVAGIAGVEKQHKKQRSLSAHRGVETRRRNKMQKQATETPSLTKSELRVITKDFNKKGLKAYVTRKLYRKAKELKND